MNDRNNISEITIDKPSKSVKRKNKIFIISNIIFSVLYVPIGGLFSLMGVMIFTLGVPDDPFTAVCSLAATSLLALMPVFCILGISFPFDIEGKSPLRLHS